jgi:hypothetical protein
MLGVYENFPANIHRIENFATSLPNGKLQQKLIQVLYELNKKTLSFDEIANPTVPECTIILEVGLADGKNFNYIDEEEKKRALNALKKTAFRTMDLFCAVRYYRGTADKRRPLRFDYYLLRAVFGENSVEVKVFHERGPRYISPEDLVTFFVNETNKASAKKILKEVDSSQ